MPPLNNFKRTCIALAISQAAGTSVQAATITVDSTTDDGTGCTLREAIISAEADSASGNGCIDGLNDDVITFDGTVFAGVETITLTSALPSLTSAITVNGTGASNLEINADALSRVFNVTGATAVVQINDLTVTGGSIAGNGGGILVDSGSDLSLNNTSVSQNNGQDAGGIFVDNASSLSLANTTISENYGSGDGGGVYIRNGSTLTLTQSSVVDNTAGLSAAGIGVDGSDATITDSTISRNTADTEGGGLYIDGNSSLALIGSTIANNTAGSAGGIYVWQSSATITNVTVSGNSASSSGGGLFLEQSSVVDVSNTTFSHNYAGSSGAGLYMSATAGTITFENSIIANSFGDDCSVDGNLITTDTATIIEDGTCGTSARSGDPGLFRLAPNGGDTMTHALKLTSIARDTGINGTCEADDQRDRLRSDGNCDVGAFELATIEVTSNQDDGTGCTLREAIESINTGTLPLINGCVVSDGQPFTSFPTISFNPSLNDSIITLAGTQIDVEEGSSVLIDASDLGKGVTIDGNDLSRIFYVQSATLQVSDLTISNGYVGDNDPLEYGGAGIFGRYSAHVALHNTTMSGHYSYYSGGAMRVRDFSHLSVVDSRIVDNESYCSGAGFRTDNFTSLYLRDSTVSDNIGYCSGAGIRVHYDSTAKIINATVSGNTATGGSAGGIRIHGRSSGTIENSTVTNNSAYYTGGGIRISTYTVVQISNTIIANNSARESAGGLRVNTGSSVTVTNSTISGNTTAQYGGGVWIYNEYGPSSSVALVNSTVANNSAAMKGDNAHLKYDSTLTLINSILADADDGPDCYNEGGLGTITSNSASIIEDGSCDAAGIGARYGEDPGLLPLDFVLGGVRAHGLETKSIARNTGILADCPDQDQRGQLRNNGDGLCDVGAIEFNGGDLPGFIVIPIGNNKAIVIPN